MNPDKVISIVAKLGLIRDKKTLQRYAKLGLVPEPNKLNLGRGTGVLVDYPDSTPYEFYGSLFLKQFGKVPYEEIFEARNLALTIKQELSDDESLIARVRELINELQEGDSALNEDLGKNYYGEGDFSDEVRLAFKERINELTEDTKLAESAIKWFYLSRKDKGKAKEMIEKILN